MTDIAIRLDSASGTAADTIHVPFFTRRMHALLRLMRIGGRRAELASRLDLADDHVCADVGLRRDRHRHDWLEAFLAR